VVLAVSASLGDPHWNIVQSPFMHEHARTTAFRQEVRVTGSTLRYQETTTVEIYGGVVEHTDENTLVRG